MKNFFKSFSFFSLGGKVYILVALFIIFLTSFSALITFRLSRTTTYNERIVELRLPLIKMSKEILHAIDRSMASSRAHIIVGNEETSKQREEDWKSATAYISGIVNTTKNLRENFVGNTSLDSIPEKLARYGRVQSKIDNVVSKHFAEMNMQLQDTALSDTTKAMIDQEYKQKMLAEILTLVNEDVIALENSLIETANTTLKAQENLLAEDLKKNQENLSNTYLITIVIALLACALSIFIAYIISKSLLKSVKRPRAFLDKLSLGEIPDNIGESKDEMNPIIKAGNKVKAMLQEASKFSIEVGKGNFEYKFEPASENDLLGNSLLSMREKLAELAEEERRRNWISSGIAKFATILRNANNNINEIGDEVLAELIKYIGANQGGLFVLNDTDKDNQFLEMVACFAYDRKKHLEKKLKVGKKFAEGLVGQVYLEKETVFLKELPEAYIKINSGLGEIEPKQLLLVPLKINDEVVGVLEVAALEKIGDYKVEFVEKISENLASTVVNLKNYGTTQKLLIESQEREEQLRAQEEEMRQNVEELSATQEEMARKQTELVSLRENLEREVATQTESLTKQKENFVSMAAAVPGVIFQLDYNSNSAGEFVFVSKGIKGLAGLGPHEMRSLSNFESLIETESLPDFKEVMQAAAQQEGNVDWEGSLSVGGNLKWVKVLAKASKNENGSVIFNGTVSDISASKEEQEQFKMQNVMLEQQEEESKKMIKEMMEQQGDYLKRIKESEIRQHALEKAMVLGESLVFEIAADYKTFAEETALWHSEAFLNEISLSQNAKTYSAFFSALLGKAKKGFDQALKNHAGKSPEEAFVWHTSDLEIKLDLVEKEGEASKLVGVVKKNKIEQAQRKGVASERKPLVGQVEIAFDEKTGSTAINIFGSEVLGILGLETTSISLDTLQERFTSIESELTFPAFIKQAFELEETQDLQWKGSWHTSEDQDFPVELKVLNMHKVQKPTLSAILLVY